MAMKNVHNSKFRVDKGFRFCACFVTDLRTNRNIEAAIRKVIRRKIYSITFCQLVEPVPGPSKPVPGPSNQGCFIADRKVFLNLHHNQH